MDRTFHPENIIEQLALNRLVFDALFTASLKADLLYRPAPGKWCILEILCHLVDEEKDDFRVRLHHVLTNPTAPLPATNPAAWMTERKYLEQSYEKKLEEFLTERFQTVRWLQSLENPNWNSTYQHPKAGPLTAKMFLVNWLAHDMHHIRQLNALQHAYLQEKTGEDLRYAGDW
jgi:hypothetical protein